MKNVVLFILTLLLILIVFSNVGNSQSILPREIVKKTVSSSNLSASFDTDAYTLRSPHYAVYANWTETSGATWEGTIRLQASIDGANWENISSTDIAMSGSGSTYWSIGDAGYLYGRTQVVVTAGSANLFIKINKK